MSDDINVEMQQAIDHLKDDLNSLRTGRANPSLIENVIVEVYGTKLRLKELANISVIENRQLLISPYDASNLTLISKAIEMDNTIGFQPMIETNVIRVTVPSMDESIRKEMVKKCKEKKENAKIVIREIRKRFNNTAKKKKESGEISEDDLRRNEKDIQNKTNLFCTKADSICESKEKEIVAI